MLKKRNFTLLSLLILGVLLLTSCLPKPPVTEGILKGQVIVPEGSVKTKDLTGQALPDATVNIIDPATGDIIATTTTDADGYYQVFVPAGGPYLLQVVKDGVVILQITPQVEVGIEYDLGTADCSTTAVALIALAMMDAGANLADINLAEIEADPNFDNVLSSVTSIIEAGGDPTVSAAIQQAVEDFLSPPAPTPTPALSSAKEINSFKFEAAKNAALSSDVIGTVDSGAHTVALTVPYGTNLTALVATFELSASANAKVGSTDQVGGTTANNFTSPVTYTVTAEDGSTQDWVVTVTVAIGPLDHFTITGYPATVTAGENFDSNNIVITAYDGDNKIKTDYTGQVYFTSTDGSATLPYTSGSKYSFTTGDNGTHTFPGIGFTLKTVGSRTIALTDGTVSVTSSSITVTAGAAASFVVTTEHSGTETVGTSFSVNITAKDSEGNTAISYTGDHNITWTWTANNSPLSTAPTKPVDGNQTFSDGVVIVTGFILTNSGETPTITATAGSVSGSTSSITVNDGTLGYIKAEDATGGTGSDVDTHSMTTLDTFSVYAAGYDDYGNYKNDESVTWTGTGVCLDKLSPTSGTSTTFTPTGEGTGTIIANHATVTDDTTGTITVLDLTVTYNGNTNTSGTAPTDSNNPYASGEEVTVLSKGTLRKTRDGISLLFTGWNTAADGSGTDQAAGSTFAIGSTNVILYAQWSDSVIRGTGPAGGLIFYDKGSYSDGWQYLEAAPYDQRYGADTTLEWGCYGTLISGADGTAVGTGEQNTIDIEAGCSDVGTAADICASIVIGGCDDWFLPSKEELNLMYENLRVFGVGGFSWDWYWSSSEVNAFGAWLQGFPPGSTPNTMQYNYPKNTSIVRVRAARAF